MGEKVRYNVTLDEEIVERAKKYFLEAGGKLSPLIDRLLDKWAKEEERKNA